MPQTDRCFAGVDNGKEGLPKNVDRSFDIYFRAQIIGMKRTQLARTVPENRANAFSDFTARAVEPRQDLDARPAGELVE